MQVEATAYETLLGSYFKQTTVNSKIIIYKKIGTFNTDWIFDNKRTVLLFFRCDDIEVMF